MNPYEQIYDVDLSKGINQKDIGTLVFEGDNNSIKVGSNVYNSGVPQQLSGSIEGKVIRQDGGTVYYVGTISDNTGYITLTEAAFAYPGPIEIFVRIVSGQDKITIGAFKAKAKRTDTGKAIDPGQPVPGIAELAEDVAELKTGKKNTQTAVSSPTASGNALAFIDTISQDAQGVITATKKSVTIDATPTENSTNPVQSGGVKAALDGKLNTIGKGINLLDNWYFVGGGSQQGGRKFPINQRGAVPHVINDGTPMYKDIDLTMPSSTYARAGMTATYVQDGVYIIDGYQRYVHANAVTSYAGPNYCIDRWQLVVNENRQVTINPNSITIRYNGSAGSNIVFQQQISAMITKGDYVISMLVLSKTGDWFINLGDARIDITSGLWSTIWNVPSGIGTTQVYLWCASAEGSIEIAAIKFEKGDTQTLAHQENGVWVLNDPPPNYNMELLKCQLSTADSSDTHSNRKLIPITANMGTVTGTGSTVTVSKTVTGVTADMTVDRIEFGTPSAVQSGWTVTTAANSVTFSATIKGSTTVKIKLSDNTDVTGT